MTTRDSSLDQPNNASVPVELSDEQLEAVAAAGGMPYQGIHGDIGMPYQGIHG